MVEAMPRMARATSERTNTIYFKSNRHAREEQIQTKKKGWVFSNLRLGILLSPDRFRTKGKIISIA
jgi:hypothetical protein